MKVPCIECGEIGRTLLPETYRCIPCKRGEGLALPPGQWVPGKHGIRTFVPEPPKVRELKPCGTPAAAKRHRDRGEPVCIKCRRGESLAQSERRRQKAINHHTKESA